MLSLILILLLLLRWRDREGEIVDLVQARFQQIVKVASFILFLGFFFLKLTNLTKNAFP